MASYFRKLSPMLPTHSFIWILFFSVLSLSYSGFYSEGGALSWKEILICFFESSQGPDYCSPFRHFYKPLHSPENWIVQKSLSVSIAVFKLTCHISYCMFWGFGGSTVLKAIRCLVAFFFASSCTDAIQILQLLNI